MSYTKNPEIYVAKEDSAEFQELSEATFAHFQPSCAYEARKVHTIIHSLWTVRTTHVMERKMQERASAEGFIHPILHKEWSKQLRMVLAMRRQAERTEIRLTKELLTARAVEAKSVALASAAVASAGTKTAVASRRISGSSDLNTNVVAMMPQAPAAEAVLSKIA